MKLLWKNIKSKTAFIFHYKLVVYYRIYVSHKSRPHNTTANFKLTIQVDGDFKHTRAHPVKGFDSKYRSSNETSII